MATLELPGSFHRVPDGASKTSNQWAPQGMLGLTSFSHRGRTQFEALWWDLRRVCILMGWEVGNVKEGDCRKEEKEKEEDSS